MKIRAAGMVSDLDRLVATLKASYEVVSVSKQYDDEDLRYKRIYIDVATEDCTVRSTLQDYQVIDYCNTWRTKSDVMHQFAISFEAAEEVLNRLEFSGALYRTLLDKKYAFIDARYIPMVEKKCGNCDHRGGFGQCCKAVDLEDTDGDYCPVDHLACNKFEPSYYAIFEVATPGNYMKMREE